MKKNKSVNYCFKFNQVEFHAVTKCHFNKFFGELICHLSLRLFNQVTFKQKFLSLFKRPTEQITSHFLFAFPWFLSATKQRKVELGENHLVYLIETREKRIDFLVTRCNHCSKVFWVAILRIFRGVLIRRHVQTACVLRSVYGVTRCIWVLNMDPVGELESFFFFFSKNNIFLYMLICPHAEKYMHIFS